MSPAAVPHKPRVFCIYDIDQSVVEYGRQKFDLTVKGEPGWEIWREEAEGVMVRSDAIDHEDIKRMNPGLKYIGKHGVGVDRIAVKELQDRGITVMNTPGVNVSSRASSPFDSWN